MHAPIQNMSKIPQNMETIPLNDPYAVGLHQFLQSQPATASQVKLVIEVIVLLYYLHFNDYNKVCMVHTGVFNGICWPNKPSVQIFI